MWRWALWVVVAAGTLVGATLLVLGEGDAQRTGAVVFAVFLGVMVVLDWAKLDWRPGRFGGRS